MRNNKGITLTSLLIYVIAMVCVIAIVSTLTSFFYKNIDIDTASIDATTQYTKFSSIFTDEINISGNKVITSKTYTENNNKVSYIVFSSGNQYTFMEENKSIYKNKIKICTNIDNCDFSYSFVDSSYVIKLEFVSGNIDKTGAKALTYTLKNK